MAAHLPDPHLWGPWDSKTGQTDKSSHKPPASEPDTPENLAMSGTGAGNTPSEALPPCCSLRAVPLGPLRLCFLIQQMGRKIPRGQDRPGEYCPAGAHQAALTPRWVTRANPDAGTSVLGPVRDQGTQKTAADPRAGGKVPTLQKCELRSA